MNFSDPEEEKKSESPLHEAGNESPDFASRNPMILEQLDKESPIKDILHSAAKPQSLFKEITNNQSASHKKSLIAQPLSTIFSNMFPFKMILYKRKKDADQKINHKRDHFREFQVLSRQTNYWAIS